MARNAELNAEMMRAIAQEIRKNWRPKLLGRGLECEITSRADSSESNEVESSSTILRGM